MKKKNRPPREVDMAPVITGTSYVVGLYKVERGTRKELKAWPVINGEPQKKHLTDTFPEEAYDVEPEMMVTVTSGVESYLVETMLRGLAEHVRRESRKKRRKESVA